MKGRTYLSKSHKNKIALIYALLPLIVACTAADAQLPDLINDEINANVYLPDFSYAGYGFGLEDIPTSKGKIFDVTTYGAIPDDGIDDSAAMLEALSAAHAYKKPAIVYIPKGRFILSEVLNINRSDIVLRGAGRGSEGTELHFPRPLRIVGDDGKLDELRKYIIDLDKRQRDKKTNLDVYFSEYSWSGGFIWIGQKGSRPAPYLEEFDTVSTPDAKALTGKRGELTLTVNDTNALSSGQWMQILWYNKTGENSPIIIALYGDADVKVGSHHWTFKNRPLVAQKTKILSIDGDQVTIANPLLHDISDTLPAQLHLWDPLENVGVEDLKISFPNAAHYGHHTEEGFNAIYFTGSANGWVRNLTTENADSGILTYSSSNLTLRDIRTQGERPAHYGVHLGNVHNILVERLQVFNPVLHSLTFNTQATRNVYTDAQVFNGSTLDQHAGANHQNLFDNVTLHIEAKRDDGKAVYPLFDGSGAGYWQPGHGGFNTAWNLNVIVESGADTDEIVTLQGLDEGPDARIIGLSGNRKFELDYRPKPYIDFLNRPITHAPSLYYYQRSQRLPK